MSWSILKVLVALSKLLNMLPQQIISIFSFLSVSYNISLKIKIKIKGLVLSRNLFANFGRRKETASHPNLVCSPPYVAIQVPAAEWRSNSKD